MIPYIKYLKYVILHKWFVLVAGVKIGAPLWRLITHDLSKLLPSEFIPYALYFYDGDIRNRETWEYGFPTECAPWGTFIEDRFAIAWLLHQRRNPHHWQYWYLKQDDGKEFSVGMPQEYLMEMVADWAGAGRAITGRWELLSWYQANKDKILIRDENRDFVEKLIAKLK